MYLLSRQELPQQGQQIDMMEFLYLAPVLVSAAYTTDSIAVVCTLVLQLYRSCALLLYHTACMFLQFC
jgi:hypothetical protein